MDRQKRLSQYTSNMITLGLMLVLVIFLLLNTIFMPIRVIYNVSVVQLKVNDTICTMYDCTIYEYSNRDVVIETLNGKLKTTIDDITYIGGNIIID